MMTEPHQRTRALLKTRVFLEQLSCPADTPRVPSDVRAFAKQMLRNYPTNDDIETAHKALPNVFGPVIQRQALGLPASEFERRR